MGNASKYPETQQLFEHLRQEKAALEAVVNPLRDRIDELQQQIHPVIEEQRALAEQIQEHTPRLVELDNQIGALARAMGARTLGGSE